MAVTSVIKLSELEGAKRIDAEYYQSVFSSCESKIKQHGYDLLGRYSEKIFSGPFGSTLKSKSYQQYGIPFIRIGNIVDISISKEDLVYISEKEHKRIFSTHLNPGDIVFSKIGTIGRLSVISETLGQVNISENNIGIRFRQLPTYERIFILFFLLSRYGQIQIKRRASGNIQPKLNVRDIESVKISKVGDETKKELAERYKHMYALYDRSLSLYSQAEDLLLEELRLKDFKPKYELSYSANLSKALGAHRVDAEYFQPAYEEVIKSIGKKIKIEKLKKVITFISHGKQPYYVENGEIPVIIQKHLGPHLLNLKSEILASVDTPSTDRKFIEIYPEYRLKVGDVLLYSVGAYLGRTNVLLEDIEAVPASFITLIRTKPEICNSTYLALFLNSKLGQIQSSRWKSASAQQYIYPKEIKEFLIPILPPETQQKIASLVQQSHEAKRMAKELLEEAKRKVEQAIETVSPN